MEKAIKSGCKINPFYQKEIQPENPFLVILGIRTSAFSSETFRLLKFCEIEVHLESSLLIRIGFQSSCFFKRSVLRLGAFF